MIRPYENDIQECMKAFLNHGVILYPTDTVWGLGCRADDEEAIQKIVRIKQRTNDKSFILLMTDTKQLGRYIASPPPDLDDIIQSFTSPTTIIYPSAINLPSSLKASDDSIGIRLTMDPFCRSLIKRIRVPLVSTSANFSGQVHPAFYAEVNPEIIQKVDYVVRWRQDDSLAVQPSDIYRMEGSGELIKLR